MRTEVDRAELVRALAAITKVVDTRNTIPLLSHVLLKTDADSITIRGTDLDVEATARIPATGDPGEIAVPGKDLADIVKRLAGDTVVLELDKTPAGSTVLLVKAGRSRFKLPTLSTDNFPTLSVDGFDSEFEADLGGLLARVSFAQATNHKRLELNGVYLHNVEGRLCAVGCDGHRLVYAEAGDAPAFPGVIVPTRLGALIGSGDQVVSVNKDRLQVQQNIGSTGSLTILGKLIEATYPDYARIWPGDNDHVLRIDRRAFREAVNRVSAVADEDIGKGVLVSVSSEGVTLAVRSDTRGEATEELAADYDGDPCSAGFNCAYLNEFLAHTPGETVEISLGGKRGANFVGDPGWRGVLMYFDVGAR